MSENDHGAIRCSSGAPRARSRNCRPIRIKAIRRSGGKRASRKRELLPVGRLRYYYKWPGHGSQHLASAALLADAPPRAAHSRRVQPENPAARKDHCRQAADLVGARLAGAGDRAAVHAARPAKYAADRRRDVRHLCGHQSMLDADHRHGGHLHAGAPTRWSARRHSARRYLSIKFGLPWWLLPPIGAVVGLDLRRNHCAAGNAARWLLLCAADARPQRIVPGLLPHLEGVRLRHRRPLRRRHLHPAIVRRSSASS